MKNRYIAMLAAICLALLLCGAGASAETGVLKLPGSLKTIEEEAFYLDSSLKTVIVQSGATDIGSRAFANSSVSAIELPDSIAHIADDAFDGCADLVMTAKDESYAADWASRNGVICAPLVSGAEGPSQAVTGRKVIFTISTEYSADYVAMYDAGGAMVKAWNWADDDVQWDSDEDSAATVWKISYAFTSASDQSFAFCASQDGISYGTPRYVPVTVKDPKPADNITTYRALLISETHFSRETAVRNQKDAELIESMLGGVTGAEGGSYAVTRQDDASQDEIESLIYAELADEADADDVSLFFIASHGDSISSGRNAGALETVDGSFLLIGDLAAWLSDVPGKVIVFVEACGSGAAIYTNGAKKGVKSLAEAAKAFDARVISAFSEADTGITETPSTPGREGFLRNTGELRTNKFYVLTAAQYQEDSYGWQTASGKRGNNYFTTWLAEGVGATGDMPADNEYSGNANGIVDLYELYSYISGVGDNHPFNIDDEVYYQHVQVYPTETRYALFK